MRLKSRNGEPYLNVSYRVDGNVEMIFNVTREAGETLVTDDRGRRVFTATRLSDGRLLVQAGRGETVAFFEAQELERLVRDVMTGQLVSSSVAIDLQRVQKRVPDAWTAELSTTSNTRSDGRTADPGAVSERKL